jgi:hypothetical protein
VTSDDEILRRLDRIQATLRLAFAPQLQQAGAAIRADAVSAAILDIAEDWTPTTQLQERVAKKAGVKARSVRERFPGLVEQGVLEVRGTEKRPEYRRTGLV